ARSARQRPTGRRAHVQGPRGEVGVRRVGAVRGPGGRGDRPLGPRQQRERPRGPHGAVPRRHRRRPVGRRDRGGDGGGV
ncbi:MAG: hypothetical protein AVDCRST_MAG89-4160, partial [uncultured Gemmatimonadetes bacterium]